MSDSLSSISNSVIFKETFNNAYNIMSNKYTKGSPFNISINNGIVSFNGTSSKITYKTINPCYTFRFKFKTSINNQKILRLSSTQSISINSSNQITSTGLSSPIYYVNSIQTQSITLNTWNEIVITTTTKVKCSDLQLGFDTTYYYGQLDIFEIYNRALNASEILLLYQSKLYTNQNNQLLLLLDFDSTQGVLNDLTGKNILNASNVSIKKIGKTYSAYFNGATAKIDCGSDFIGTKNVTVGVWLKRAGNGSGTHSRILTNNQFLMADAGAFTNNGGQFTSDNYAGSYLQISTYSKNYFEFIILCRNGINSALGRYNDTLTFGASGTPTTGITNIFIGNNLAGNEAFKGYIAKLQVYEGIPSNINNFAAQLYNSQKIILGL